MEKNWKIQVSNWTKIPLETAILILKESEDYLSYTISESDKITSKAFAFILLSISAIGALIGVTISELNSDTVAECFILLNIIYVILVFLLILHFVRIHFPRYLMMKGRRPEEVSSENYIAPKNLSKDEIHLSFVLNEIENSKVKIDFNDSSNRKRIKLLKTGIIISCVLFFSYYLLMLIIKF